MNKKILILAITLLTSTLWAASLHHTENSNSTASLSLEKLLQDVKQNNPEIAAAQAALKASAADIDAAGAWSKPELGAEFMYTPGGSFITQADEKNWTLKQNFKVPSYYGLQKDVAKAQLRLQAVQLKQKENEVLAEARKAYSMYNHAFHVLEFYQENIAVLRRFAKVAEGKYIAGLATQGDVLKAQVELTRMLNTQVKVQQEQEIARAMLSKLLNQPAEQPLARPEYPAWHKLDKTYATLLGEAEQQKPELLAASINVELAQLAINQIQTDYWPEFMAQYRNRSSASNGNTYDAMLGVTLPLWRSNLNASEQSALARRAMAEAEANAAQNAVAYDIKRQVVNVQTNERFVELYENSVLPQAQQALQVTEASYQSGKSSFLDLLDAQRLVVVSNQEYHEYLDEHEQALADLEKAVGGSL